MSLTRINEQSAVHATFTFVDEDGAAVIPSTVDYRLDNHTTGAELIGWTSLTPAASVEVTIDATYQTLASSSRTHELRMITVRANSALTTESHQQLEYRVVNLPYVT